MPDWLTQLKTDLKEITLPAAKKFWPGVSPEDEPYYNYRYQHVEQVERDARRLLKTYGGDEDIVLASVWIHDRCQPRYEQESHGALAAEWAETNLAKTGFPAEKVHAVAYAVENHSNPPQTIPETAKEARILWDADKLSKIGATSIVYMLCSCPAFPQTKVDFRWIIQELRSWKEKDKTLALSFYFPLSRELGLERHKAFEAFREALEKETGIE
ncbi:MAG: HD domain-containing protein [Dehalococcoidales bacterium]